MMSWALKFSSRLWSLSLRKNPIKLLQRTTLGTSTHFSSILPRPSIPPHHLRLQPSKLPKSKAALQFLPNQPTNPSLSKAQCIHQSPPSLALSRFIINFLKSLVPTRSPLQPPRLSSGTPSYHEDLPAMLLLLLLSVTQATYIETERLS